MVPSQPPSSLAPPSAPAHCPQLCPTAMQQTLELGKLDPDGIQDTELPWGGVLEHTARRLWGKGFSLPSPHFHHLLSRPLITWEAGLVHSGCVETQSSLSAFKPPARRRGPDPRTKQGLEWQEGLHFVPPLPAWAPQASLCSTQTRSPSRQTVLGNLTFRHPGRGIPQAAGAAWLLWQGLGVYSKRERVR